MAKHPTDAASSCQETVGYPLEIFREATRPAIAMAVAVAVGLWRWAHRNDDWVEDGDVYCYEEWEEWYEER